ncbi:MAG: asparagine synthase (glutamine-hydrolyzing) [Bryobacterales bacterium]|nr:asparagine synthase (glutamine-hydrolyzing) [Bryobacterales bacterium]
MCGIAGFTHTGRPADPAVAREMAERLRHRGPDQQGTYESPDVSLAAVRLKIIDLAGGEQPVHAGDGDHVIVFNGEIYNHAALRRELESRGHRFDSLCDTEVVLRAFIEWDRFCFARLRGMFAAAVWSERRRRLVLARDRLGIKPLYILERGACLHFGSEMKALFAHPEVERSLDLAALDHYLALNWTPSPNTPVAGVRKLPAGTWLAWEDGRTRAEPYWNLRFEPSSRWTLGSAREALDALLQEAVREHLVSDVPLGVWSSGGIDSSTILHYAAHASSRPLKTFSVSFRGRSFDESPWFREVAERYGTEHHEFDLNPEVELADAIEKFAWYADEPTADAGALPVWFLSRMSRQTVTVALAGDGGDELFGGYLTYLADRYARWMRLTPALLRRGTLAALQRWWPVSDDKISYEYMAKRMLEGSLLPADEAHFFWNGTGSREQRGQLLAGGGASLVPLMEGIDTPPLNRYLLADHRYYLADDILTKVDRMSMAHSLEVRPPFLDHRIVEFAASLPESFKIRGSRLKWILKETMRDKLPPSVLRRKKMGFDVPAHEWFRGPLRPLLLDTLSESAIRATGVFSPSAVHRLIDDHLERRINAGYNLWGLLILFLWMRAWGVGSFSSPQSSTSDASSARPA